MPNEQKAPTMGVTEKPRTAGRRDFRGQSQDRDSGRRSRRRAPSREQDEFSQQMIDLARVTRVMAGGKRMRFRACVVIGDRKGRIGWAAAKASDVSQAIQKAVAKAKKDIVTVSIVEGTIPHEVRVKYKAARLILKPAKKGRGLIAGGAVRTVLDLAGVKDIVSKMYGSPNKVNNVAATFLALSQLRRVDQKKSEEKSEARAETKQSTANKKE